MTVEGNDIEKATPETLAQSLFKVTMEQHPPPVTQSDRGIRSPMNRHNNVPTPLDFAPQPFLIENPVESGIVPQRPRDGYINATAMCKAAGKLFADYGRLNQTQSFLEELSLDMGIPISKLVQVIQGRGDKITQGTWVHPRVAINLAQWLSPKFAVMVTDWVFDWMAGNVRSFMPLHVRRFLKNRSKILHTHFSMLNEIYLNLVAPLEDCGIILPERMTPDISTGRMFSDFLRKKGIDPEQFPSYDHEFLDGTRPTVVARLYPIEHLVAFRKYFNEVWLPQKAKNYFGERFPKALPFLPQILPLPDRTL